MCPLPSSWRATRAELLVIAQRPFFLGNGILEITANMDVDTLDRILKDRGVEVERQRLAEVLRDEGFADWAELHLSPATLLSPDELATYVTCLNPSPSRSPTPTLTPSPVPLPSIRNPPRPGRARQLTRIQLHGPVLHRRPRGSWRRHPGPGRRAARRGGAAGRDPRDREVHGGHRRADRDAEDAEGGAGAVREGEDRRRGEEGGCCG